MDTNQKLINIYTTLNQIEIKGDTNIEYMYGVLVTLKGLIAESDKQQVEVAKQDKENNKNNLK